MRGVSPNTWASAPSRPHAGQPTSAKRGLEIETTDRSVEVKDFAGKVKPLGRFGFHRFRIDFFQVYTPSGTSAFSKPNVPLMANRHCLT